MSSAARATKTLTATYEVVVELGDGSVTEFELSSDFKVLGTDGEEAEA
jgi:hypothetical protein